MNKNVDFFNAVYTVIEVTHTFSNGKFLQKLHAIRDALTDLNSAKFAQVTPNNPAGNPPTAESNTKIPSTSDNSVATASNVTSSTATSYKEVASLPSNTPISDSTPVSARESLNAFNTAFTSQTSMVRDPNAAWATLTPQQQTAILSGSGETKDQFLQNFNKTPIVVN